MSKQIIELLEADATTIANVLANGYFAIDTANVTYKLSGPFLKNLIVNTKDANSTYVVESNYTATSWYRVWSDGWCEQGGYIATTSKNKTAYTILLTKKYADTNYFINVTRENPSSCGSPLNASNIVMSSKTTKTFQIISVCQESHTAIYWETRGKI